MATITLEDMRRISREFACQESLTPTDAFVERNPELDNRINEHLCDLRNLLIEVQGQGWAAKTHTIPLVVNQELYNLPVDFDELLGVRLERGSEQRNLDPFTYADLGALETTTAYVYPQGYRYRIKNSGIMIKPTPAVADTVYLDYIPAYEPLDNDPKAKSFEMPYNAWKWAALGVAIDMLNKENDHAAAGALGRVRLQEEQRIRSKGARRDRRAPRINDTRRDLYRNHPWRRGRPRLWYT
jgi:hypothetical protein